MHLQHFDRNTRKCNFALKETLQNTPNRLYLRDSSKEKQSKHFKTIREWRSFRIQVCSFLVAKLLNCRILTCRDPVYRKLTQRKYLKMYKKCVFW